MPPSYVGGGILFFGSNIRGCVGKSNVHISICDTHIAYFVPTSTVKRDDQQIFVDIMIIRIIVKIMRECRHVEATISPTEAVGLSFIYRRVIPAEVPSVRH